MTDRVFWLVIACVVGALIALWVDTGINGRERALNREKKKIEGFTDKCVRLGFDYEITFHDDSFHSISVKCVEN